MDYCILIPAYKPQSIMLPFIDELCTRTHDIVIVDDGSGAEFAPLFNELKNKGLTVLTHPKNAGKGRALKTGIKYIAQSYPDCKGIITADCDGQHTVNDIIRVRDELIAHPDDLIVGGRELKENVPLRSRIGNGLMRFTYRVASGNKVHDTQTGLRGIPAHLFPMLFELKGERYEYEMNMLLMLKRWGVRPREIVIETIYIDNNSGSHYDSFKDSMRIGKHIFAFMLSSLWRVLKFGAASIASYVFEYLLYQVLLLIGPLNGTIWLCNIIARICSSLFNYTLNNKLVFNKNNGKHTLLKYALLVVVVMMLSTGCIELLSTAFGALFNVSAKGASNWVKPLVDVIFFFTNYFVQRDFIFGHKQGKKDGENK